MSESATQNNQNHQQNSGTVLISPHLSTSSHHNSHPLLQLGIMASGSGTNMAAVAKELTDAGRAAILLGPGALNHPQGSALRRQALCPLKRL